MDCGGIGPASRSKIRAPPDVGRRPPAAARWSSTFPRRSAPQAEHLTLVDLQVEAIEAVTCPPASSAAETRMVAVIERIPLASVHRSCGLATYPASRSRRRAWRVACSHDRQVRVLRERTWHAPTDAPSSSAAVFIPGEHGPISLVKGSGARALKSISKPGERGVASELIGQIVAEANTKEVRRTEGPSRTWTPQAAVEDVLHDLEPAAAAAKKLPPDEAAGRGVVPRHRPSGRAVGQCGQPDEQASIDKLATLFGTTPA